MVTANAAEFGLQSGKHYISGQSKKDRYLAYQHEYHREYGVFPELDLINKPFTALFDDIREGHLQIVKKGFWGALTCPDINNKFNKKFRKLYDQYKKEWSFLTTLTNSYGAFIPTLDAIEPGIYVSNNLGYMKDESGNYSEGTWENNRLKYGFVYFPEHEVVLAGWFYHKSSQENAPVYCKGVSRHLHKGETKIGTFMISENYFGLYSDLCFIMSEDKHDEYELYIGPYENKYENGTFYAKFLTSDGIKVRRIRYVDGEKRGGISCLEIYVRSLLLFWYSFIAYMVIFTYGLPFFLIYKHIQKKKLQ